ncbi:MAG: hypothetical protein SGI92_11660 [Bryobacteraceae bacterium]|nr:hypothetical protein [Bryobacteraceae bacterium]
MSKVAAGFLLLAAVALGAVEGTVQNMTTGKPQAGATVTLVELGAGMKSEGAVKTDAQGKLPSPRRPTLLRRIWCRPSWMA